MPSPYNGIPGNIVFPSTLNIASSTNTNPIQITTSGVHGLHNGDQVDVSGHLVNTSANGLWSVTVTGLSTFTVPVAGVGVGGATGTVSPQTMGATYNEPSDGDDFDASAFNPAYSALGDRSVKLAVLTGAHKLVTPGDFNLEADSGSHNTPLFNYTGLTSGTWTVSSAPPVWQVNGLLSTDIVEATLDFSFNASTCTGLGFSFFVSNHNSLLDYGAAVNPANFQKVFGSAKFFGNAVQGSGVLRAFTIFGGGAKAGFAQFRVFATDDGGGGGAVVSVSGDYIFQARVWRPTGMPQ